jgi:hypothetical protein
MRAKAMSVGLTAFFILLLFDLKVLSSHAWDPHSFVLQAHSDSPDGPTWGVGGVGYDGQFSYQIASNPIGSVKGLDSPNYRYQRIFFPMLVKLLSMGKTEMVPWIMLFVNLVSAGGGCAVLGVLLIRRRASPWLALVWVFSLGYLLTIRLGLLEPLALFLALGGWLAYDKGRMWWAIGLFALGGLTKEIALLFPIALAGYEFLHHNWKLAMALVVGSLGPYVLLYLFLAYVFGIPPIAAQQTRLLLFPFFGMKYLDNLPSRVVTGLWTVFPALILILWAISDVYRNRLKNDNAQDVVLVIVQTGLIATLPALTWVDPIAVLRFSLGLIAAALLWGASHHPRLLIYIFALWLPSGLILFLIPGMI